MEISGGDNSSFKLEGLRLGDDTSLHWPWDQGITIVYGSGSDAESVTLDAASLYPGVGRRVEVLDDSGDSVLARIGPPSP